jgi:Icc protein
MIKNLLAGSLLLLLLCACNRPESGQSPEEEGFTFVFLTDIHLKPEMGATEGFQMAIDTVNAMQPDFVLTGGDLIDDALRASHGRADSLYRLYKEMSAGFQMPVYNAMGNHEHYGFTAQPPVDPSDPDYGDRMFERQIGKRYYSFDHKGWHFMVLEGTTESDEGRYVGLIEEAQLNWIREDLSGVDPATPIVLVTHIPLVSVMPQIQHGPLYADNQGTLIINQQQVLAPFRKMNLKLVLQGHLHFLEEINMLDRVRFITGGAVCGTWWRTPDDADLQEGFLKVKVSGDDFTWDYVDYGWSTGINSNQ